MARGAALPDAFLELHVEQGPVLAEADAPLGVVTGIVGYVRGELVFDGRAGHAGTTPMDGREDALVAAAEAVLRIRDAARGIDGAVATVGQLTSSRAASNVIPDRVRLSVDARAPDSERLDELVAAIGLDAGASGPSRRTWMRRCAVAAARRRSTERDLPWSSSPRVRATTRGSSRPRACRARCSSSAA